MEVMNGVGMTQGLLVFVEIENIITPFHESKLFKPF